MKKRWNWLWILCFCLLATGCSSGEYQRDTSPGEIKKITLSQMDTMMVQEKDFAVMFTQTTCGYCQEFHMILDEYQKNHHLVMYEVVLDEEEATPDENLAIIHRYFPDFSVTPGIFYAVNGKQKAHLAPDAQGITMEHLERWVQKYELDKKAE